MERNSARLLRGGRGNERLHTHLKSHYNIDDYHQIEDDLWDCFSFLEDYSAVLGDTFLRDIRDLDESEFSIPEVRALKMTSNFVKRLFFNFFFQVGFSVKNGWFFSLKKTNRQLTRAPPTRSPPIYLFPSIFFSPFFQEWS